MEGLRKEGWCRVKKSLHFSKSEIMVSRYLHFSYRVVLSGIPTFVETQDLIKLYAKLHLYEHLSVEASK